MNKNLSLSECLNTLNKQQINKLYIKYNNKTNNKNISINEKKEIITEGILISFMSLCMSLTSTEEKELEKIINEEKNRIYSCIYTY